MTARPPAFSTAAATASELVATAASPIPAASARRKTCTIIGSAVQIRQWFAGQPCRCKARGMRTIVSGIGVPGAGHDVTNVENAAGAYTGCQRPGKPVSDRRRQVPGGIRSAPSRPLREPKFDEFLRTEQNPRRRTRHLSDLALAQYRGRRHFCAAQAGQARVQYCRQGESGGEKAGAAKEPEQPIETLLAKASVEKGQATAKQCLACHTFEKGGPNRVGPNLWNIVGSERGEGRGGFNFSAAMKSQRRKMDLRRTQQVSGKSARNISRERR